MNQQLKNQIISHFAEDWGDSSPQFIMCEKIFDYLLSQPVDQLTHLTYGSIQVAIGEYQSDVEIVRVIQYLCGDRTPVLSLHFKLSDNDDDDICYPLDYDDIRDARIHGTLVHPETSELIENYESKVLMYFTPSPLIE